MAALNIIESMNDPALFEPWFSGESWANWKTLLKGAFALEMTDDERAFFHSISDRDPPTKQVKELWVIAGRRAGKDSVASAIAAYVAAMFQPEGRLRPGERALVACVATDRDQSKIVLNFTRSYFNDIPMLNSMVQRETAVGFELSNSVDIAVSTNSFRAVRGRPILAAVLDEVAFYMSENSAAPDVETYNALTPGMASLAPDAMLIAISSPYKKSGLLYRKFRDHYGKDDDVLVVRAPTTVLNPTIDERIIAKAMEDDPAVARAEWFGEFRDDIADYIDRDIVEACVTPNCLERPRIPGVKYFAFADPSGGSSNSMTLAISHGEEGRAVLDLVREVRAPFQPESAVSEFAQVLKSYGLREVRGDRYAGMWPTDAFARHGITYRPAQMPKNDLYVSFLPLLNSRKAELLDNPRLVSQLAALERNTSRGGRDSIDHPSGAHDDLANCVAGALVMTETRYQPPKTFLGTWANPTGMPKATKFPDGIIDDPADPCFGGNATSVFRL